MAEFKIITKDGSDPQGKPRVYFTCHPEDFDRVFFNDKLSCFERICKDVFSSHDCAIRYTESMTDAIDLDNIDVDLGYMQLFVIPITWNLLSKPSRAMTVDIAYAKEHNIPILPFMMESGIDEVYSLPENFGERQYLNPYSTDKTEVYYTEKLKNHLESLLVSNETAQRIRESFDAYVFLSYRKKDRRFANEVMATIHNIPGCRDIAIWYDEFLPLGESWRENIKKAMMLVKEKSNLFTLLVTPNVLEEYIDENGEIRKNFVMGIEYPEARTMGMNILATEMEHTSYEALKNKFDEIPVPIKSEDVKFADELLSAVGDLIISDNDNDPEHNYLIGLAYLNGIDVEINSERGIELITKAAEANHIMAMVELRDIYRLGYKTQINYGKALKWAKKIEEYYTKECADNNTWVVISRRNLLLAYMEYGDFDEALKIGRRILKDWKKNPDESIVFKFDVLKQLAHVYYELDKIDAALSLLSGLYEAIAEDPQIDAMDLYSILNMITLCFVRSGDLNEAIRIQKEICDDSEKILGKNSEYTVGLMANLASYYERRGDRESRLKALDIFKSVYPLFCQIYGENNTLSLKIKLNIANIYGRIDNLGRALKMKKEIYQTALEIYGEKHPLTLQAINNLAHTYGKTGAYDIAIEYQERSYDLHRDVFGNSHRFTLIAYANLANTLFVSARDEARAFDIVKRIRHVCEKNLGKNHESSIVTSSIYEALRGKYGN